MNGKLAIGLAGVVGLVGGAILENTLHPVQRTKDRFFSPKKDPAKDSAAAAADILNERMGGNKEDIKFDPVK